MAAIDQSVPDPYAINIRVLCSSESGQPLGAVQTSSLGERLEGLLHQGYSSSYAMMTCIQLLNMGKISIGLEGHVERIELENKDALLPKEVATKVFDIVADRCMNTQNSGMEATQKVSIRPKP